jgi:pyrroline-5-carboxylate reductase
MTCGLKIGIVGGAGWLGSAIADAMLKAGVLPEDCLGVSYRSQPPGRWPKAFATGDSQSLADWSDVVLLSVRPADWPPLQINASGRLVVSVMAGVTIGQLAAQHQTDRIVRAMPNVFATVGHSYTPWVGSLRLGAEDRLIVNRIFAACGVSEEYAAEADLDYLTGLTGSGPAFPALFAESLIADAIARGISANRARRAVTEMLIGTGRLLELGQQQVGEIVGEFIAYRGTTAAAIDAMRAAGLNNAVSEGLSAALRKSLSMGTTS